MAAGMVGTKGTWQSPKEEKQDPQWACLGHMLEVSSHTSRLQMTLSNTNSQGLEEVPEQSKAFHAPSRLDIYSTQGHCIGADL